MNQLVIFLVYNLYICIYVCINILFVQDDDKNRICFLLLTRKVESKDKSSDTVTLCHVNQLSRKLVLARKCDLFLQLAK